MLYLLLPVLLLAACGREGGLPYGAFTPPPTSEVPQRYYPPPGPPDDPWGPYIREAAARYDVPEQWIRAVMQQESGGEEQAVSPVGAMGLMQIMPDTYEDLQAEYGLGLDPFNPHDNILAGSAYIHKMYDRYGSPGFLAGYNAGPERVDAYLAGEMKLPRETVNYVAAIAPNLGDSVPTSGPFTAYAAAGAAGMSRSGASAQSLAAGCDLDAAYDPDHPCTSLEAAAAAPAPGVVGQQTGTNGCNLDAAYDPNRPCDAANPMAVAYAAPPPSAVRRAPPRRIELALNEDCDPNAAFDPDRPCPAMARRDPPAPGREMSSVRRPVPRHALTLPARAWAIQVGAFRSPTLARAVAEGARRQAPSQLRYASLTLPETPFRRAVLYRARLAHLSEREATEACTHLNRHQLPCVVVRPSRS